MKAGHSDHLYSADKEDTETETDSDIETGEAIADTGDVSPPPAADPEMNAEAKSSTKCSHCGKIFPQPYRLKRHIREVHDLEKFHKCEDCNKTFSKIDNLKRHKISVHNKIRPYACLNCDAKFKDKSALKYHTKKNVCMSRSFDTFFDYTIL